MMRIERSWDDVPEWIRGSDGGMRKKSEVSRDVGMRVEGREIKR